MTKKDNEKLPKASLELGLGGILKGLGDLVEKLGDLAKTGEQLSQMGEIHGPGKELKGIYGFTVKVGLGDDRPARRAVRQHPQGPEIRAHRGAGSPRTGCRRLRGRRPRAGGGRDAWHQRGRRANYVEDDLLTISAERGDKKYRKEVLLPGSCVREKIQVTCNNGVVEIKCQR